MPFPKFQLYDVTVFTELFVKVTIPVQLLDEVYAKLAHGLLSTIIVTGTVNVGTNGSFEVI